MTNITIGPKQDRVSAMKEKDWSSDKMENELEMQKSNKRSTNREEEVGGREGKTSFTGLLGKLTPDKSNKKL